MTCVCVCVFQQTERSNSQEQESVFPQPDSVSDDSRQIPRLHCYSPDSQSDVASPLQARSSSGMSSDTGISVGSISSVAAEESYEGEGETEDMSEDTSPSPLLGR